MKLPDLIYGNNKVRRQTIAFGGVNYSENHAEGEWEQTENLGSGRWPALAPRLGRAVARECEGAPSALYAWEELASVEGTGFYYGGYYIGEVAAGPKQMVRVGDQIVIWPDKKYFDLKTWEFTELAVGFSLPMGNASAVGENYLAVPIETYEFVETGDPPVSYSGGWLNVSSDGREGKELWAASSAVSSTRCIYINQVRTGYYLFNEQYGTPYGCVQEVIVEEREYLPGVMRDYITLRYTGYQNSSTQGTVQGWSNTRDPQITNAPYGPNFGSEGYVYEKGRNVVQEGYVQKSMPREAVAGAIINYNETTKTAQRVEEIKMTVYEDHVWVESYTLQNVKLQRTSLNEDPETTAQRLGIEVGDRVRVSRGGARIDTVVAGFDEQYTSNGNTPGMASATLGIEFADSMTSLRRQSGPVSINRITDPNLDFICVHDNRLWGVHDNRIYCSVFGDPQDFRAETGTDADAWWTEVGSPGDWTGIVSYSGTVLAFKENLVHKVVGDLPSEFTVSTYNIAGIQPGSHQSAVIVNEVLYYKGTNGVYAYSGYTPSFISANFGERKFHNAVGGTDGMRYYLSMQDESDAWQMYCYDTIRGVWLREDELHAAAFSLHDGKLYCAAEEQGKILTFGETVEPGISWSAMSVPFYEGSFDRKQVTKLLVRAELPAGSAIRVAISYDGGAWQELYNTRAPRWRVAILPVRPKRCDSFRLRVMGEGDVTLRGIAREVLTGSDR